MVGRRDGRRRRLGPVAESGFGLLSSILGAVVFLSFLLFSVQVLLDLYTRSVASAAAFDGARIMASGGSLDEARSRITKLLGRLNPSVESIGSGDEVVLHVHVVAPGFSFPFAGRVLEPFRTIDRTAHVRIEQLQ